MLNFLSDICGMVKWTNIYLNINFSVLNIYFTEMLSV